MSRDNNLGARQARQPDPAGSRWRTSAGRRSLTASKRRGGPMTEYVTSADGTRIAYDRQGSGPPVILIAAAMQFRAFDPTTVEMAAAARGPRLRRRQLRPARSRREPRRGADHARADHRRPARAHRRRARRHRRRRRPVRLLVGRLDRARGRSGRPARVEARAVRGAARPRGRQRGRGVPRGAARAHRGGRPRRHPRGVHGRHAARVARGRQAEPRLADDARRRAEPRGRRRVARVDAVGARAPSSGAASARRPS